MVGCCHSGSGQPICCPSVRGVRTFLMKSTLALWTDQHGDYSCRMAGSREGRRQADTTGLPNITDIVDKKRHALFGHIVRLDSSVPAHQALKQVIAMKAGRCSGMNWRRLPGRPRKTWIQQIGDGTTTSWKQMRCGRVQRSVDIVGSRRNGPQPYMRHDDDDDDRGYVFLTRSVETNTKVV